MHFAHLRPVYDPFVNHFNQLQNEFQHLFQRLGDDVAVAFPAVNVHEENDTLIVEAEVPGLALEDLSIYVNGADQLSIKGERKLAQVEKSVQHRRERQAGKFERMLTLPFPVDAARVEAKLENGILTITLPKHENAKPRKVVVKG